MSTSKYTRKFLDSLRMFVKGGTGGNGYPKFGGVGGKGGDVYIQGIKDISLSATKKSKKASKWKAGDGKPSSQYRILGENGNDLIISAPLGIALKTESGQNLGNLIMEDDKVLVARGGSGGNSDNHFIGQKGEQHHVQLLLKLIADIGLVGFPNAGKSTLLRAISHAKPKVASYPFTTLEPTVGMLRFNDLREISMADLPGLIEGAWLNYGMGHKFLRHVERTKLLLFVVDIEGFRLGPEYPARSAIETVILLNRELELYQPELVEKPAVLLINKVDKPDSERNLEIIKKQILSIKDIAATMSEELRPERFVTFGEVLDCSAKFDRNSVTNVKNKLREILDLYNRQNEEHSLIELHDKIKDNMYEKKLKLL